ncbi:MAG: hypothetical protein ACOYMD_08655, partial [Paludibacter sp.]
MKKNNFLLAIFLLFPLIAFSQWETTDISGFGSPTPKEALSMVKVGTKLVVAINGSGIYTSTDAGENWAADNGGFSPTTEVVAHMMVNNDTIYVTTTTSGITFKAYGLDTPLAWKVIGKKSTGTFPNTIPTQMAFIGGDMYLGTNSNGVMKRTLATGVWATLPFPKDSTVTDTKSVLAIIEDNGKILAGFDNDKTGARLYDPSLNTWSDVSSGLKVIGNTQANIALLDSKKYYQRIRYFYKDGTTIYAATKRSYKDFNHKGIYSCTSGTYTWAANSTGLANHEATPVLSFAKVG